jgi:hypothetical protein
LCLGDPEVVVPRRVALPAVVALLLMLAGCLGGLGPDGSVRGEGTPVPDAEPGLTADAGTDTAARAATDTAAGPWGSEPIVVGIDAPPGRDVSPLVRAATAYWEANAPQYAGYAVDYAVEPDATNPDLVLRFVDEITGCERSHDAAGCAPYITQAGQIDRPVVVEIKAGLSDESTVRVVKHELGHTLGLGHDDQPQAVMRTGVTLATLPQPDATDRAFPWQDGEFTVFVDVSDAPDPDAARTQIRRALDYYERGAPGMAANLSFRIVDDPDAELVVAYRSQSDCTEGSGSCGASRGPDPDGDGTSEYYAQFRVTVVGLDTDAVGWHTGYWLAEAFGAEADGEKPPPFRNASYEERRSEWWQ